ncbi:MAG: LacI family DNA-binding transcriptional regulator [Phototrophicaceae bacterium]
MARGPTIIDVAKLAGVSKATAARVLNGQQELVKETTRERVSVAAEQLGYVRNAIAGSLRTDRTFVIALSIPDITNPFWPEVARGVQDTTEAEGYTTVIVNTDWKSDREQSMLNMVRRNRFDGLIINVVDTPIIELEKLHIPIVLLGVSERYPKVNSVGSDTAGGAEKAMQHLYELGHRRIALISGLSRRYSIRDESYVAFHAHYKLPIDSDLVIEGDFTRQAGYSAMQKLLKLKNPPTAVFTANDSIAIGALKAANMMSWRVPEDISIIGMDDINASTVTSPELTTISKPKYEIGVNAAQILLNCIEHGSNIPTKKLKMNCELIVRASTAQPRVKMPKQS